MRKLLLFIFFLPFVLFAEESWEIHQINFSIEGATKEEALRDWMELDEGDIFTSYEDLTEALEKLQLQLNNNRIFEENARVTWQSGSYFGERNLVDVFVVVEDSWNLIMVPYGQYDSNTGLQLSIKLRNYNFLGNMEALTMDFEYSAADETLEFTTKIPIGNLVNELTYNVDKVGDDFIYGFILSSYYNWPIYISDHRFTLKTSETVNSNFSLQTDYSSFFLSSGLALNSYWDLPFEIYQGYKPRYTGELRTEINYLPNPTLPISESRDGLNTEFEHSLLLGGTQWNGNNYKEGIVFHLGNEMAYLWDNSLSIHNRWSGKVYASGEYYGDMYPWGTALRLYGIQDLYGQRELGEYFRGILDDRVSGGGALILNTALYLTVWNWEDIWEWYGGPTLDIGYLYDVPEGQDNLIYSLGLEGMCYPHKIRSLFARLSVGVDLNSFKDQQGDIATRLNNNVELFFGLGSFY
ncbi:MAG: hypothetical protein PF447_08755 [Spirochaetaceae bacterium]|nr:hypothetical protein [Spirochaetaceae bacterium]